MNAQFQALNDRGITILMVTHELDIASFSKRKVVMRTEYDPGSSATTSYPIRD